MKTVRSRFATAVLLATLLSVSSTWAAVSVGQIDTFEDGTTQGWIGGLGMGAPHPAPPVNALGGPGGASDNFLQLTSVGGGGSGGRLSVLNLSQWTGNYIAAGVNSISMDLINLGNTNLSLRLVFEDPTTGPPSNIAFSQSAFMLPAGSGWTHAVFPISVSDLQAGLGDVTTALTNTTAIRLYHSASPNFPNPVFPIAPIVAQVGVDNIQASAARVPDGGSTALLLLPVLLAATFAKRHFKVLGS